MLLIFVNMVLLMRGQILRSEKLSGERENRIQTHRLSGISYGKLFIASLLGNCKGFDV